MPKIQVDAFDVQLGAALLLQFKDAAGATVRVLADAGSPHENAASYPPERVAGLLDEAFGAFDGSSRRIDLIVGTHYDSDHLKGLVSVVQDASIDIGEAWLPPVVDDASPPTRGQSVRSDQFLPIRFAAEDGEEVLARYLKAKREICDALERLEDRFGLVERENPEAIRYPQIIRAPKLRFKALLEGDDATAGAAASTEAEKSAAPDIDYDLAFFDYHLKDAWRSLDRPVERCHGHGDLFEGADHSRFDWRDSRRFRSYYDDEKGGLSVAKAEYFIRRDWDAEGGRGAVNTASLAYIRAAEAEKAINAKALAALVAALKARRIPIRCRFIEDGAPLRFVWDAASRRFSPGQTLASSGPTLTLLGPSRQLIDKHRDILPVGNYMHLASKALIPIKGITPSNQLSYVIVAESDKQRLLISGDTGFDDFRPLGTSQPYFSALLKALQPLHVIQVAHHGGHNSHFYRVLLDADYPEQKAASYLLLSHATDDKHRPSEAFGKFVAEARRDGDDMTLLFTGRPTAHRVADFSALIAPTTEASGRDRGDVRLAYDKAWSVVRHPVGY
ncbi:hypothetical protein AS593_04420 [Caulobacter vibrioides]|nr:hypothetical protein AS593_04420 [Caulobacter vibrioides]